jgi:HAD superfamily phosphoserine phosphatase-like hydrolase
MPVCARFAVDYVQTSSSSATSRAIALFDLDGTLIPWDCQLLFRHFVVRREPWRALLLPVFLIFTPLAGLLGTECMKRIFLSYLWRIDARELAAYAREFAQSLMPAIYPQLRERIERHRRADDLLILTSASPEFYVREIGKLLGFDISLGTVVIPGTLFPDLDNHKGTAKVARLHEVLDSSYFVDGLLLGSCGYTDSRADLPMLAICERALVVNPDARLSAMAGEKGWEIVRPARPWKSPLDRARRLIALLFGLGRDPGGINAARL